MLLVHANGLVLAETIMEELWREDLPPSASTTLQTYIYQIRGALGRATIMTRPGGYCLSVDESDLDLLRFRTKLHQGRCLLDMGQPDEALDELRGGLSLWNGRPLSNVRVGSLLELDLQHLESMRPWANRVNAVGSGSPQLDAGEPFASPGRTRGGCARSRVLV